MADETTEMVTLVDEEGQKHQFSLLDVVELDERCYALMVPAGEELADEEEEEEAYIFRMETDENGEEVLVDIDDDEEFERVRAALDELDADAEDEEDE